MIEINFSKWMDFFTIVVSSFVVAMAGNYFFQWDFEFGLIAGICLGIWNSLYDMGVNILMVLGGEEEEEPESGPPDV